MILCSRYRYITHFYCLAVEAGFYSDVVECLPLDPAAQVRIPPRAVGIFLHPVTFGGQYVGPRLGFRASLSRKCPGITAWFRVDSGTNQFKAGKYVVGIGIYNTLLLLCGRSRLLQRRGRVFVFRSCGPGSIPTSGGWDFSAPCDNCKLRNFREGLFSRSFTKIKPRKNGEITAVY